MIKAVVFDLDDTLISEMDYIKSGFVAAAERISIDHKVSKDKVLQNMLEIFNISSKKVFNRVLDSVHKKYTSKYIKELIAVYRNHNPEIAFFEDVIQTLVNLRKYGYKLGMITDGYKETQNKKLDKLNCRGLFDLIIVTDELGRDYWKPDERAYRLMAEGLGIELKNMVYIGDNVSKDFITANRLGITTMRVLRNGGIYSEGEYRMEYLPKYQLTDLNQLMSYLLDEKLAERIN